tara:strand:- start:301 stop:1584 length:1284 start_codon:yes stop_codon:yes gene_type:complete
MVNIIKFFLLLYITQSYAFVANSFNPITYKNRNNLKFNLKMRYMSDRRYLFENIYKGASIVTISTLLPPKNIAEIIDNDPVVVFGAGGYTGGDVVRSLLKKGKNVVAVTRRNVNITTRENSTYDSLIVDNISDKKNIKSVIADVLKPETLNNIMEGASAVIFCAASRPKVKPTATPGTKYYNDTNNKISNNEDNVAPESNNVENIGLLNVGNIVNNLKIKKLIIVSSICAKCQIGDKNKYENGDNVDIGAASCNACYKKQNGEESIRELYMNNPKNFGYTIVRPGMLSPGEERGTSCVEFNQGVSKSGIISRLDLAEVLVSAAISEQASGKTFEVYYRDTAQPVDMYVSLKSCKELGKSVKECFFGEGYDENEPISLDNIMNKPLKGTLFTSGKEVLGKSYSTMFEKLKKDEEFIFDINTISSNKII